MSSRESVPPKSSKVTNNDSSSESEVKIDQSSDSDHEIAIDTRNSSSSDAPIKSSRSKRSQSSVKSNQNSKSKRIKSPKIKLSSSSDSDSEDYSRSSYSYSASDSYYSDSDSDENNQKKISHKKVERNRKRTFKDSKNLASNNNIVINANIIIESEDEEAVEKNPKNISGNENNKNENVENEDESYDSDNSDSHELQSIKDTESPTNEVQGGFKFDPDNMLPEHDISCRIFQYRSIADSILRSINMFREASLKPVLIEDKRLGRAAMNHSRRIVNGETEFNTDDIQSQISTYPFVYFCAQVAHYSSMDNAFTNVVNLWTTDVTVSKQLLANFNCGGVGVCLNKADEVYFTLILALRSNIGYSFYSGTSLYSILLAEKCINMANEIRTRDFGLLPYRLDLTLCDHAFRFAKMNIKELTPEFLKEKIGICSQFKISFCQIKLKDASPKNIIQNMMNQIGKTKTILGDFNRVGYGFIQKEDKLFGVILYTRTLHAAVIDGTETIMDGSIISNQIIEIMNEFRQQHSLPPMNMDVNLCQSAQEHTEYIANGQEGLNPLDDEFYCTQVESNYIASDISHMCCNEISRAPKVFMAKWRNNVDCISVLLNQVDDVGVGVCFDKDYVCHITVIIASKGNYANINNIIVKL